jgi:TM2 domain-containing membrane protein YozV
MFCSHCGAQVTAGAAFCIKCGTSAAGGPAAAGTPFGASAPPPGWTAPPPVAVPRGAKSKLVAALLGIFVGAFGVHRFYLGYNTIGAIQLVLGLLGILTCGITTIGAGIWGLIEGILILTGNIDRDAQGQPLVD